MNTVEGDAEFVVVANRLPIEPVYEDMNPDLEIIGWRTSPGGLVSALDPVLRGRKSVWVGAGELAPDQVGAFEQTRLDAVSIPAADYLDYYSGFANTAIWPLYHAAVIAPEFHRPQFDAYSRVNSLFADRVAELAAEGGTVWVHDYQLQLVPQALRPLRPDVLIGFFLHIPFPPAILFAQVPWRKQILRGMLGSDLVGFQTHQDASHFIDACKRILGVRVQDGKVLIDGRAVRVAAFPIGIDAQSYSDTARDPAVQQRAREFREELGNPQTLMLGIDRLDYTKGIDVRIKAFAELLESERLDPATTVLVQVAVPSRENLSDYRAIRDEVELLVGRVNGSLARVGTNPINYMRRVLTREELVALYVAADVMLVTPLRDGMNLVAKEYVATHNDNSGALVLSEFTGAAVQLVDAWLVNPFDAAGVEDAICAAVFATPSEKSNRMRSLRRGVFEDNVNLWASQFLSALQSSSGLEETTSEPSANSAPPLKELASTPRLLICCDYDGTISPLVDDPKKALPLDGAIRALRKLSMLPSTTVAVVSGRALRDLAELSRLPSEIHLVGSHGSEFDRGLTLDAQQLHLLDQVISAVKDLVAGVAGAHVELKPSSAAVHVRMSSEPDRERLLREVVMGPGQFPGVVIRHGKGVVELSVVNSQKSDAVNVLRQRVGATAVMFIGDDVTDESVFEILSGLDIGVKVGDGPTAAPWQVNEPQDVMRLLEDLHSLRESWLLGGHTEPIEDFVLLSNRHSVALLSPTGSIDWLCAPHPDSPAIFAALLGDDSSGHFSVQPAKNTGVLAQTYVSGTLTARTRWADLSVVDYMPVSISSEDSHLRLIRRLSGTVPALISFAPRPQFGSVAVRFEVRQDRLIVIGVTDPIELLAPGVEWEIHDEAGHQTATAIVDPSHGDVILELRFGAHETGEILNEQSEALLRAATEKTWTSWLAGLSLPGIRPRAEVRAALTLRALSHAPTGGILAAATTSLPERLGGIRNWDYRYCWIRDAALTARELVAIGSMEEGDALVRWIKEIDSSLDGAESMRPLYRLDGGAAGAEGVVDSLPGYAGSRPVRTGNAAQGQLQLDVFGTVCLLIDELSARRGEVTADEWHLTCRMVDAVRRRWREPDHGIWEIRDIPRHHTYSKMMCWIAVHEGISIAERIGQSNSEWVDLRREIANDISTSGWSEELDSFAAAYDQPEADASVLHGLLEGYPASMEQIMGTVAFVERHLREQSGVYRYRFDDGLPNGEGAMHICATWLAGAYIRMGSAEDALQLLDSLLALAGNTGLLSEQVNPITGQGLGNHPQAYSHVGILAVCRLLALDAKAQS